MNAHLNLVSSFARRRLVQGRGNCMAQEPAPLPEFGSPPVSEVALSVEFEPLENWRSTHAGYIGGSSEKNIRKPKLSHRCRRKLRRSVENSRKLQRFE
jgi:hypothetical protein